MITLIPESAPFAPEQRAWLNGLIAGIVGLDTATASPGTTPAADDDGDMPWHDPALDLAEREKLAEGRPLRLRLMAAMGQLDCGQCGYQCRTYAEALATGTERDGARCVPGGKATARAVKKLLAESPVQPAPAAAPKPDTAIPMGPSRDNPAKLRLVACTRLTDPGSEKDTRAVVLSLEGSGITYAPGDSLGIWPTNNPEAVELILSILRAKGSKPVVLDAQTLTAREALTSRVSLREPTAELFALMAEHATLDFEAQRLAWLAEDDTRAAQRGVHDVFDALMKFRSSRPPVAPFVRALAPLQPRLYSIASSPKAHPGEVHLCVGVVHYELDGRGYVGLGSGFLAEYVPTGRSVRAYLQPSHGFRLPADDTTPVIMVGPGTGIAPFRAFLAERAATGARGRNWLFFGAQHGATDFLYRDEIERWHGTGVLTRLSLAFSRDQSEKVYVQHRMAEEADELWRWLNEGAYFYVCGDAKRMAADVELALAGVAMSCGGMDAEAARAWIRRLESEGRYLRDVY